MKNATFLLLTLFVLPTILNAQCIREGSLSAIDDPSNYPVEGTATQSFLTDGTKQVIFGSNFETVQGIELRVFLTTTERLGLGGQELEITDEPLQDDNGGMDMGDAITGIKIFNLPLEVNLEDYTYVIIQCVQANVLWGRATLGALQGDDCAILGMEESTLQDFAMYPNPAANIVSFNGLNAESFEIRIFDASGKFLLKHPKNQGSIIDISNLSKGLYLVNISNNRLSTTRQLLVQ